MKRAFFPSSAKDPEAQRLLNAARELMALALAREIDGAPPAYCTSGFVAPLRFGVLNRIQKPHDGLFVLPFIEPENINVPLYVAKTSATGTATVRSIQTSLNTSPTGVAWTTPGLSVFINDGADWWST